jgi:phosphatidylserine/phosphatidylglycerophosphate/cardiolipin synthase-like enzyme
MSSLSALIVAVALLFGGQAAIPQAGATAAPAAHKPKNEIDKKPPERYDVPTGPRMNLPNGPREARRRIIGHLLHTINSVPGGQKIRFATWNMRSDDIVNALIAAHRRGVSVRVVIDRLNSNPRNPNHGFVRLTNALKFGQKQRPQSMKSFTRECVSACRGPGGIAHVKFYLFSKVRTAKNTSVSNVVMYGSANATDLAAFGQWNDLYTLRGQGAEYKEFNHVFQQMIRDRNVEQPYLTYEHGNLTTYFYPYRGAGTAHDPLMHVLNQIVCKGATGGTGTHGHTRIRIAQTSMWGDRGIMIAQRLRQMWQRGCDIKIVYAVMGNEVLSVLRHTSRGSVPLRQIAQDFNRDGVYDKYLHMKNMAVSGHYAGVGNARVTWNGSANWTSVALASDEVVGRIYSGKVMRQYSNWVDFLFAHPPLFSCNPTCGGISDPGGRVMVGGKYVTAGQRWTQRDVLARARERGVDPYAKMRKALGIPAYVDLPR